MEAVKYNRGKWLEKEDDLLKKAYHKFETHCWRKISEMVATRSPIQCMHRWTKILKPGLTKGKWTKEEDVILSKYVKLYGSDKNWLEIARHLPGRSSKQCRERWTNILQPGVKKGEWTSEDDKTLFKYYLQYGAKWTEIATFMNGRTENSIKNRFYSTLRRFANKDRQNGVLEASPETLCKEKLLQYVERALVENTNFKCKRGRKPFNCVDCNGKIRKSKTLSKIGNYKIVDIPIRRVKSCIQISTKKKVKKVFNIRRVTSKTKFFNELFQNDETRKSQGMSSSLVNTSIEKDVRSMLESVISLDTLPASEANLHLHQIISKNNNILEHFRFIKNRGEEPMDSARAHIQSQLEDTEVLLKGLEDKLKVS